MPRSNRARAVESVKPRFHQTWWMQLLLALWRWLPELLIIGGIVTAFVWLTRLDIPAWAAAATIVAPVAVLLLIPGVNRVIIGWFWVDITRHRLRSFFSENGLRNRSGRLPWLLVIYPTKVGEAAWVVLVGGLCCQDVEERLRSLGSTCFAREGRVVAHRKFAHLIRLEVIRRDPFETSKPIKSKLLGRKDAPQLLPAGIAGSGSYEGRSSNWSIGIGIPTQASTDNGRDAGSSNGRGDDAPAKPNIAKSTTKTAPKTKPASDAGHVPVLVGGEDVSDYV